MPPYAYGQHLRKSALASSRAMREGLENIAGTGAQISLPAETAPIMALRHAMTETGRNTRSNTLPPDQPLSPSRLSPGLQLSRDGPARAFMCRISPPPQRSAR